LLSSIGGFFQRGNHGILMVSSGIDKVFIWRLGMFVMFSEMGDGEG
jgi:hypothetical protein